MLITDLAQVIEQMLPNTKVIALLDFGSRTKEEAVRQSDLDIRAYVMSDKLLLHQQPAKLMAPIDDISWIETNIAKKHNLEIYNPGWEITEQLRNQQLSLRYL